MPHRQRIDLEDVAATPNLDAALWAAARHKRARPDVVAFLSDTPAQMARVRQALLAGRQPDGHLRQFAINDPKPRLIHAAPFADRVAHHALMRLMAPRLEQALVPTSFACRPGKGVHAALHHAQRQMLAKPAAWVLQLDVWHCFPQLPHEPLLALLARRFKGSAMALASQVVHGHETSPGSGRGLPIGSLTSQHFANQYLGEIDRFALARPECMAHVRYMDDLLLWCDNRAAGQALLAALTDHTEKTLQLQFKQPKLLPVKAGLAFGGHRIGPGGLRPGRRRQRAWASHWRATHALWLAGTLSERQAQCRAEVLHALCLPSRPLAWQRSVMGQSFELDMHP